MAKNYFYITLLAALFFTTGALAQDNKQPKTQEDASIEGLSLYPNPVATGKVYITSKKDSEKEIIIFDVLGKKVLQTVISTKELNISNLSPGIYIIKITEEGATSSRKLIVQ
ncbi:T9SS type A sorting domain-containing protein [Flavobacterium sp. 5]|uniref:T9SS type A sorting domain-containing protein n=1 Tax=Flavobacterium sp. 5 TaxID=2035199 RepID=UPI000C2C47AC|nr:T9SS type A sorting domain-containing protein [Flavobacterium sp. 5]PKB16332.1 putative secreted protein (Por secretion system target) [Flavobacterium sp. 5]